MITSSIVYFLCSVSVQFECRHRDILVNRVRPELITLFILSYI